MKEELITKLNTFHQELQKPFIGRDEEVKVILLSLVTGEHTVLIGEPGTAKSALIRRAAQLLNAKIFIYLLTKFTEPSELFGPLDINALKQGKYIRITKHKLPEAEIVFLDEIFKANSAILNSILSILNERVLYDGYTEIKVPLWSLFGASNEVPDDPELEALYDRMLLRQHVKPISDELWKDLLNYTWKLEKEVEKIEPVMSMSDLMEINKEIFNVSLEPIKTKLIKIFAILESKGIHLSDRRKGKSLKVIAANALLNNRYKAVEEDLLVLKYIAPKDIEDFEKVNLILSEELKTPHKYLRELEEIKISVREIVSYISSFPRAPMSRFLEERLNEIYRDLEATRERVASMIIESGDKTVEKVGKDVLEQINAVMDLIRKRLE